MSEQSVRAQAATGKQQTERSPHNSAPARGNRL